MTYPEAIAIVGGSVAAVVGIAYTLIRLLRRNGNSNLVFPINASTGISKLIDAAKEQTDLLGEIRDILIETRGETHLIGREGAHTQRIVEKLHDRFDRLLDASGRST